ncbi:MAG: alpha/beta hydrolase [Rhodococcus sp. (in: high G+C Gram-positive bacteria)]
MTLAEFDTRRKTVDTDRGPVSYLDSGAGRVAFFIHGVGTSGYLWRNAIRQLENERRCIALDLPLHGHTPASPDQDFTLGALADVVEATCDALGLDTVDVVANDTGGAVAQIYAARHPDRLSTLTLTNCETHDNVPPKAFLPAVLLARAGLLTRILPPLTRKVTRARTLLYGIGYQNVRALPEEVVAAYVEPLLGTRERALLFQRWIASLHPRDLLAVEPDLAALEVPTLIVWGTGDLFFRTTWAYRLRDLVPGAREVVEIRGGKLFFPDERSRELVVELRRFWAARS